MVYMFTLDSHDYFGPFQSEAGLHEWAKAKGFSSYAIEEAVPSSAVVHKPWE